MKANPHIHHPQVQKFVVKCRVCGRPLWAVGSRERMLCADHDPKTRVWNQEKAAWMAKGGVAGR